MSISDVRWVRSEPASVNWAKIGGDVVRGAVLFAGAAILGLTVFIALLRSGAFGSMQILFYRGIVLAVVTSILVAACVAVVALRAPRWASVRDSIAVAALVFGLNVSVLTVVPVTIDRSISIFLLGYMEENSKRSLTVDELDQVFRRIYLTDLAQIERRMLEQKATGHVVKDGTGWRITDRGRGFVTTAKRLGTIFDVDTRLLSPSTITAQPPPAPIGR